MPNQFVNWLLMNFLIKKDEAIHISLGYSEKVSKNYIKIIKEFRNDWGF